MDEDMVNLLDVAARVIDLLDEADRELLARFCGSPRVQWRAGCAAPAGAGALACSA